MGPRNSVYNTVEDGSRSLTKLHIIPRKLGGEDSRENVCLIQKYRHTAYHLMFGVVHPTEVIRILVEVFWNNQWHYVEEALRKHYAKELRS